MIPRLFIQRSKLALACGLILALAGCNSGPDEASAEIVVSKTIRQLIKQQFEPDPEPVVVTRAILDGLAEPHIEVIVEKRDLTGYLGLRRIRHDDLPGEITHWSAADGTALSFRNGMLIASRGLGGNLLSAAVPAKSDIPGPAHGGQRSYQLRAGDNEARAIIMACTVQDLGPEQLEIVERSYATRHLREQCESSSGTEQTATRPVIVNDYWVDSSRGKVWKSRQWGGPEIGYLRFRDFSS